MKQQIIDWVIAQIVHRLKVAPRVLAILAASMASALYGLNYFEAMGYDIPDQIMNNQGIVGFVLGLVLQGHSSAYLKKGEDKSTEQNNPYSPN